MNDDDPLFAHGTAGIWKRIAFAEVRPDFRRRGREVLARQSGPLRGANTPPGNHGHRADLLLCAPGATVGMRSSRHPVVGKRRPSMPVAGALLVEFPSAQFAARCWSADRWPRGWHCEEVWEWACAYRLDGSGTHCAASHNWHNWHIGHGTATTAGPVAGGSRRLDRR